MSSKYERQQKARATIFVATVSAIVNELFTEGQDYTECLKQITDEKIHINGEHYILSRGAQGQWVLYKHGAYDWCVSFDYDPIEAYRDPYNAKVVMKHATTVEVITELTGWVTEILSSYHPNGNPQ